MRDICKLCKPIPARSGIPLKAALQPLLFYTTLSFSYLLSIPFIYHSQSLTRKSYMAPVALETLPVVVLKDNDVAAPAVKAPALVIGSLSSAQDGSYQRIVSDLEATRRVERQMVDRLLDGGMVYSMIR